MIVEPIEKSNSYLESNAIATVLQTIGNTRLLLYHPTNRTGHLKDYYQSKGWEIEDVD